MKTILLIPATILFYFGAQVNPAPKNLQSSTKDDKILNSLHVSADHVTECKDSKCMISSKEKAKAFKNSVVIVKDHKKWRLEKDTKRKNELIDSYAGSNLVMWYGNAKLEGVKLKKGEEIEVVVLN